MASELFLNVHRNFYLTETTLFLFGTAGEKVNIKNGEDFNQDVVLNDEGFISVKLPAAAMMEGTGVNNQGFQITSEKDNISGYLSNRQGATSDMSIIFDKETLGTDYLLASAGDFGSDGGQFSVQAVEDNTEFTLTLTNGQTLTQTLNAGETFKFSTDDRIVNRDLGIDIPVNFDLTGSYISSNKDVAVFSGHSCTRVGFGACDHIVEQMPPIDVLKNKYIVGEAFDNGTGNNLIRVVAAHDNTEVKIDGELVATINKGEFHEFTLSDNAKVIETSEKALTLQYLQGRTTAGNEGDPAMMFVPGVSDWLKSYNLATPTGDDAFADNSINIIIPKSALDSLELNDAPVDTSGFTQVGDTEYYVGNVDIEPGVFDIKANAEFQVSLFGYDFYDSYLTFGAAKFAAGTSNAAPLAVDDALTIKEDQSGAGNALTNDSDSDNDSLIVTQVNGDGANVGTQILTAKGGLATVNADGTFAYDPNGAFDALNQGQTDTDTISYQISDGNGGFNTANINVLIEGVDDPIIDDPVDDDDKNAPTEIGRSIHDPHLVTFDGYGYSLQTVGEYTLFAVPENDVNVQVRQAAYGNSTTAAVNIALAMKAGDSAVGLYATDGGSARLFFGDEAQTLNSGDTAEFNGVTVERNGSWYEFTAPSGETVNIHDRSGFLNIYAAVFDDDKEVYGLLGNANNDRSDEFTTRDGTILKNITKEVIHNEFSDSWRITDETSLLLYGDGETTADYTDFDFPSDIRTLADFTEEEINQARAALRELGVEGDGFDFDNAVLDFLLTGDERFTDIPEDAEEPEIVIGENTAPNAVNDGFTVGEAGTLANKNVLTNDGDADADPIEVFSVNGKTENVGTEIQTEEGGLVTLNADGTFDYNPNGQFDDLKDGETDTDRFSYEISDGNGGFNTAQVNITIEGEGEVLDSADITGTPQKDYLFGTNDADVIKALAGDDVVNGRLGDDTIYGGLGSDFLVDDGGNDKIFGGYDNDHIQGREGDDFLYGEHGNDEIFGGNGIDNIFGGIGNDQLFGGFGNDIIEGNAGDDFIRGNGGDDRLFGNENNDLIFGDQGNDFLSGGDGVDSLFGNVGDDILIGGLGADTLHGNNGADIFRYTSMNDTVIGAADQIVNFETWADIIDLAPLGVSASALTIVDNGGTNFTASFGANTELNVQTAAGQTLTAAHFNFA